jgi:hypothetical protein
MKRRLPPPPVPTLSDSAIERVERNVFAALDARAIRPDAVPGTRRRLLAFALAGAALTGGAFGLREWRHASAPASHPIQTAIQLASEVATEFTTTASGSHIDITGAALDVAPQSAVKVVAGAAPGAGGAVVVVLERGAVTCEVAPRTTRAPFVVQAGQTRVTVIGTRFTVRRVGDHATVSVQHGLVEVADTDMTQLVHAGETFRPGERVTREPLASAEDAAPSAPAPQVASPAPPPARATHRRRVADARDVEAPVAAPRAAEDVAPEAPAAVAQPPADVAQAAALAPAPEVGAPRRSVQVLFELAAQLELKDPPAALRIYGELAAGPDGDGWAASALFASARLEAERGQEARARDLAAAYLRRFPAGPNAADARALIAPAR